jgi:hypothetical protein
MVKPTWNKLPQLVAVRTQRGQTLDKPSADELDAAMDGFETRAGFQFPKSYRDFMHWFGPGWFTRWFAICGPIPERLRGEVSDVFDIDSQREMLLAPGYWADSCDPDKLRRLVLFASTEGCDWFFWDTSDVRDAKKHEYGIYYHSRGNLDGEVVLMAPSFKAFVLEVALAPNYPLSNHAREVEMEHWPAWPAKPTKRRKPK